MGVHQSLFSGKGLHPMDKMQNIIYDRYFIGKEIQQFQDFHVAFVDLCKDLNAILPGNHYTVANSDAIQEFYKEWKNLKEEENKKKRFCDFMNKSVVFSEANHRATLVTGIVAPTAAVIVKKTWKNTPLLNLIPLHLTPTFFFVPSFTLLSLIGVKVVHLNHKREI